MARSSHVFCVLHYPNILCIHVPVSFSQHATLLYTLLHTYDDCHPPHLSVVYPNPMEEELEEDHIIEQEEGQRGGRSRKKGDDDLWRPQGKYYVLNVNISMYVTFVNVYVQ